MIRPTKAQSGYLYTKAKKVWKQELISKGQWKCKRCGRTPEDQPHHSRGRLGTLKWDTRFFVSLCSACHSWAHNHPGKARELELMPHIGGWNSVPRLEEAV